MNINHLKYASEVDKTGSISRAADNLYMSQPNLSKAIKELENTLGFFIFKRTSKGITTTQKGRDFLKYARNILSQMEVMEQMYGKTSQNLRQCFSLSIPRASYIAHAFTQFVNTLDRTKEIEINFTETNAIAAINNIVDGNANIAVIRCPIGNLSYFEAMLHEKGFKFEKLMEFEYLALMSAKSKIANEEIVEIKDISNMIEILHGDLSVPYNSANEADHGSVSKKIYVYERGSQFDLLRKTHDTFIWVSPCPKELLDTYGLVQKRCSGNADVHCDLLIYPLEYKLTELDERFVGILKNVISEMKI